jgi:hypothetical protein
MKRPGTRLAVWLAMAVVLLPGCAKDDDRDRQSAALDDSAREAIFLRAEGWFESGWLSRPDDALESTVAFRLAPLLIHTADVLARPLLGAVSRDRSGNLLVDPSRPTVYFAQSTIRIDGREYERWSYVWWYASSPDPTPPVAVQGIRMTLDEAGYPMIWEVRSDRTGASVVFVTDEIELAARDAFGPPIVGRNFSVEYGLDRTPAVVVARLLDSGPMPLGPFAYIDLDSKDLLTLICRCSSSQVGEIQGGDDYALVPLESSEVDWPTGDPSPDALIRMPAASR